MTFSPARLHRAIARRALHAAPPSPPPVPVGPGQVFFPQLGDVQVHRPLGHAAGSKEATVKSRGGNRAEHGQT